MNDQIEPADAARALSEIGRQREQVIRRSAAIPRWFWWASAVLTIAFAADIDYTSLRGALFWAGVALFAAGTLAVNGLRLRAVRGAPLRPDLVAPGSVPRLLAGGSGPRGGRDRRDAGDRAQPGGGRGALSGHDRRRGRHGGARGRRADADAVPHSRPGAPARGAGMITPGFDELIHAPTRLSLVAFLAATGWADFSVLRDSLGLSDSALSKQLATLEDADYIEIRKAFAGKRPRTSARLTPAGRTAFDRHVLALQEIVAGTPGRWPLPGSRSAAPDGGPAPGVSP